jgi:hypothetical protein
MKSVPRLKKNMTNKEKSLRDEHFIKKKFNNSFYPKGYQLQGHSKLIRSKTGNMNRGFTFHKPESKKKIQYALIGKKKIYKLKKGQNLDYIIHNA